MRIAIFSDIHANLQALVRAMSIIDELKIDEIYCLGDIIGYGGNPNECVSIIRRRAGYCVQGNHDAAVLDSTERVFLPTDGFKVIEWTRGVLTKENYEYLSNLPLTIETELCTLVHAAPSSPEVWNYIDNPEDAKKEFGYFSKHICFFGHTHIPVICSENLKSFTLTKDSRFMINPGSIGQPRDGNPHLSFGIFDTEKWSYDTIRLDYDIAGAAEAIVRNGLPEDLAKRLYRGI